VTHTYIKPSSNQRSPPHAKRPPHGRLRPNALFVEVEPKRQNLAGATGPFLSAGTEESVPRIADISTKRCMGRRLLEMTTVTLGIEASAI
jgi:hypothetical protein